MLGKDQTMGPMWNNQQKEIDLEDPMSLIDQVYLGCTQKEAKVDPQTVQSKTEAFEKLTTTREPEKKDQTNENCSLEEIAVWSYDMEGHAEKCVERYCES